MKTNITMESKKSRDLYGITIKQETSTYMLSLSDLQEAYTRARIENGWSDKSIGHIITRETNVDRIYFLLRKQDILDDKMTLTSFHEKVKEDGIVKILKELGAYKTTGRGPTKRTMCNPYIWVMIALELNPEIYAKVIFWITDNLILNRIEACDLNNNLRNELWKHIDKPNYAAINTALNIKIFGKHQTGMRNFASEEELAKLSRLEENIAFCIARGFLKTNQEIIQEIKK